MRRIWAGPRPFALLRAGVRLSRGPLRCRAAHQSLRSCPSHPSRIPAFPPDTPAAQRDPVPRAGPPHFAPCANAALRSSLLRPSSLGLLWLQSLHSAGRRYRKPTPRPASRWSASRPPPTHRTAARPRKAPKRPSRRPSAPPDAAAGHRLKMPATCPQSLRSGHAGRSKARFAEGFIGEAPQTPAIMPWLPPGHPPRLPRPKKGRYRLTRPAPPSVHWGQPQIPQKCF